MILSKGTINIFRHRISNTSQNNAPSTDYGGFQAVNEDLAKANEKKDSIIWLLKWSFAILVFICAIIQTCLDYLRFIHLSKDISNNGWQRYQCSIFLFVNSGNVIHAISAVFALASTAIIRQFDKKNKYMLIIFFCGEIFFGILVTPFLAGFFTHALVGFFVYGWISVVIFGASVVLLWKVMYFCTFVHFLCVIFVCNLYDFLLICMRIFYFYGCFFFSDEKF